MVVVGSITKGLVTRGLLVLNSGSGNTVLISYSYVLAT